MTQIVDFLLAVINNWAGYATGGVLVASIGLYFVWKDKPMPRTFGFWLAGFCLLMACYKAWNDERLKAEAAQSKYDLVSKPLLEPHIDQLLFAPVGTDGQSSLVTFTTTVVNKGAPSMFGKVHSYLVLPDDRRVEGAYVLPPEEGVKIRLGFGDDGRDIVFQGKDYLPTKALSAVPTGGAVQGYYQAVFDVPVTVLQQGGTFLHIAFADINERSYDGKTLIHTRQDVPPDPRHLQDFMRMRKR